jgi:PAS domain S-box-containing protein
MNERETVAELKAPAAAATFLAGGGEMGAMMRAHDWSRSAIGPCEGWPQSLRTAAAILLNSGYPMYLAWGREFVQLYNDAYRPILGSTKHPAALGASTTETFAEIWDFIGPMFRRVMATGEASTYIDQLLPMDRHGYVEECTFTFSYSAVRQEDGSVGGVFVTVLETTERVLRERRDATLRDLASCLHPTSEAEICRAAAQALVREPRDAPFALLYVVRDGHAELAASAGLKAGCAAAPAAIALTDAGAAWAIGRAAAETEPLAAEVPAGIELAAPAWPEPVRQAVIAPILPAGCTSPSAFLVMGVSPRRAIDRDYLAFCSSASERIARALSEAAAFEAERRRAEMLAELDRAKTAFFSNVSHEFRTPLTLMLGTLEQTLAGEITERQRPELEVAHRNSLRLLRLVNTLLDFSRVEASRLEASYEPVDLSTLTAELASNFRSACERAGLEFTADCEGLPEPVYVDREMWEKVVLNLISNAFKFTFEGGIAVRLRADDGHAVLTVSDTGTGIPKDDQEKVFQRFHRVTGARGRTHEGTGIGLALVQELVRLHGGTVRLESAPGEGSAFSVSIPLGSAHLPAERIGSVRRLVSTSLRAQAFVDEALRWLPGDDRPGGPAAEHESAAGTAEVAGKALDRKRVLVVDDNADMRDYLARLLRPFHEIETAADGLEALGAIAAHTPDLVLSDVMMPGLDGFGLLRAVRSDPAIADTPVILLSARAGEESKVEGLGTGADDYLVKPFSARELLARVNTHLQMAKLRREAIAAVHQRTAQFETLLNEAPLGVYLVDAQFRIRAVNPTARPVFGDIPDLIGRDFDEVIHVLWSNAYADELVRKFRHTLESGEPYFTPERIEDRRDRGVKESYEWQINRIPLPDGTHGVVCYFRDISERLKADERQRLLINELNHRVKNTLAIVQSIAMQTSRSAPTVADFHDSFIARIAALSRAHELLTQSSWQAASLTDVVRRALEPYRSAQDRIIVNGPAMRLTPSAALALNLALHELVTNAAKYGALSAPTGRVEVDWSIERDASVPVLDLRWVERDGPPVAPPCRRGFGSRMIERGIALELDGEVRLDFQPEGVQCLIRLPMSERIVLS